MSRGKPRESPAYQHDGGPHHQHHDGGYQHDDLLRAAWSASRPPCSAGAPSFACSSAQASLPLWSWHIDRHQREGRQVVNLCNS